MKLEFFGYVQFDDMEKSFTTVEEYNAFVKGLLEDGVDFYAETSTNCEHEELVEPDDCDEDFDADTELAFRLAKVIGKLSETEKDLLTKTLELYDKLID